MSRTTLIFLAAIVLLLAPVPAAQSKPSRSVLVLNSFHKGLPRTDTVVSGIESTFHDDTEYDYTLTMEYMDTMRTDYNTDYKQLLHQMYRYKYGKPVFDVIIATDANALSFLIEYRGRLFPGIPIVFCGVKVFHVPERIDPSSMTGIMAAAPTIQNTLVQILRLHPDTKDIVVVADSTVVGNYGWERVVPLLKHYSGVEFTRIDSSVGKLELEKRLASLPDDAVVLYLSFYRDADGAYYPPDRGIALVTQSSRRPVYAIRERFLGQGIVGGSILGGLAQGQQAAEMALRILKGASVAKIPIRKSPPRYMFDFRQLEQFGIDSRKLPAGSIIINQPTGFYVRYKNLVWIFTAIIAALLVLIVIMQLYLLERKRSEQRLRTARDEFRALYDDNPHMYFTVDKNGRVLSINRFGAEQLGYTVEELVGKSIIDFCSEELKGQAQAELKACLAEPDKVHSWEIRKVLKNGQLVWVKETARVVAHEGEDRAILIVCEDVTEARKLSDQIIHQATHDALTGLVNRREFERRLETLIKSAKEKSTQHALLYLDLDQFKIVNDTCGHVAGDEMLRQVATLLLGKIRQRDTLARLGGDEFGVLLEHCSVGEASNIGDILRESLQDFRFGWQDQSFSIGVSIGVVEITNSSDNMTSVLSAADSACYAAKDQGRGRVHVYQPDDDELAQRHGEMQYVSRIQRALEEDRFRLYYQSIHPVRDGGQYVAHGEILLRMTDAQGKLIPPGAFIPAAERYHQMNAVDRWVIQHVFNTLRRTEPAKCPGLYSINISGQSLGDPRFLDFVIHQLQKTGIAPEQICFEITETAAIANLAEARRFIVELRQRRCRFALDDFGSGLSSFAYLKTLSVDYLKIDGIFVKDMATDPIDCSIVTAINQIGQQMGMQTIAEFVENSAILAKLRGIGVNFAQGFGMSRPRPLTLMAAEGVGMVCEQSDPQV